MNRKDAGRIEVPRFDRDFLASEHRVSRIGGGALGGKASGLAFASEVLRERFDAARHPDFEVAVPSMVVLGTDVFDRFMAQGDLREIALSGERDERIAHAFQRADIPAAFVGDLQALVDGMRLPLAVRSSSLLEDALDHPMAGVYATKMVPNDPPDRMARFHALVEAIKFVWSSTFFRSARDYLRAIGRSVEEEKMAVVIQEVVGLPHGERFYPHCSGVGRSFNCYPTGPARPEDGVVNLALGLGKTIVDGGVCWTYSPAHPAVPPPFAGTRDLLRSTQLTFWAVRLGKPPFHDPVHETEYLVQADLAAAEFDGTLDRVASTYVAASDRLTPGIGPKGPRVLDFAPILRLDSVPLNALLRDLLAVYTDATESDVEIEFAVTLPDRKRERRARLGFLQVRPMAVAGEDLEIDEAELTEPGVLAGSHRVLGNGVIDGVRDIVYVRPEGFETRLMRDLPGEIEPMNRRLVEEGRPYLLIGFGRWGSADPWLGIPVVWGQIGGARALVEITLPDLDVEPSQGSHFFHNVSSLGVGYCFVHHATDPAVDWEWLGGLPEAGASEHVRHVRIPEPLEIRLDGRRGYGVIRRPAAAGDPSEAS